LELGASKLLKLPDVNWSDTGGLPTGATPSFSPNPSFIGQNGGTTQESVAVAKSTQKGDYVDTILVSWVDTQSGKMITSGGSANVRITDPSVTIETVTTSGGNGFIKINLAPTQTDAQGPFTVLLTYTRNGMGQPQYTLFSHDKAAGDYDFLMCCLMAPTHERMRTGL
jgi:hypothetical protein